MYNYYAFLKYPLSFKRKMMKPKLFFLFSTKGLRLSGTRFRLTPLWRKAWPNLRSRLSAGGPLTSGRRETWGHHWGRACQPAPAATSAGWDSRWRRRRLEEAAGDIKEEEWGDFKSDAAAAAALKSSLFSRWLADAPAHTHTFQDQRMVPTQALDGVRRREQRKGITYNGLWQATV